MASGLVTSGNGAKLRGLMEISAVESSTFKVRKARVD